MTKCENCEFFITENMHDAEGECHAKAPSPLVLANGFKIRRAEYILEWPPVQSSNSCGEGEPKEGTRYYLVDGMLV